MSKRRRVAFKPVTAAVLTVVWLILWGSVSPLTIVSGLLLSWLITVAFPLPPVHWAGRFSLLGAVLLLWHLLKDLVVSSARMVYLALSPKVQLNAGIVRIDLHTDNDLYQVATAELISLVPGTVVVEVVRQPRRLYLHAIDLFDDDAVAAVRRNAELVESRVIRAFGSKQERSEFAASLLARPVKAAPKLEDEDS